MSWILQFPQDQEPGWQDVLATVGKSRALWESLTRHLQDTYNVLPNMQYSSCSAQPGWNVKYQKKGKALCTLYPAQDYFIALVVVGPKNEETVSSFVEQGLFSKYVCELYHSSRPMAMGRWLMIEVRESDVLQDVKTLISIRMEHT